MKNKLWVIGLSLIVSRYLYSGFDFGGDNSCEGGSGTFKQEIEYWNGDPEKAVTVGIIPKDLKNVSIFLKSDEDVDIRLYDAENGTKIVHWPDGILHGPNKETTTYNGVTIEYSGYNGDGTGLGHEYIKIMGVTQNDFVMKAFGYKAGYAEVEYLWDGKVNCDESSTPSTSGSGDFAQEILQNDVVTVGDIPPGINNLYITLKADEDVDIQLYDRDDGIAIIAWPNGILSGPDKQTINYKGMEIEWSGYNGDGTGLGHEYIKINGETTCNLTMKAYGYKAGYAQVHYEWGKSSDKISINSITLTIDSDYTIHRSGNIGDKLIWVIEKDGVIVLKRNAENELEYKYYNNTEGSSFRVWIEKYIDGKYKVVSNIVEYTVSSIPPTKSGTAPVLISPVQDKIVLRHNYYRNLDFQDSNLSWDSTLALHAQQWADYLATHYTQADADSGVSPHASQFNSAIHGLPYKNEGENIAWASGGLEYVLDDPVDITKPGSAGYINGKFGAVDMWANEKAYYDYESNSGHGYVVGHYTQVVWQKTSKVGCGKAESKTDYPGSYVVCRYYIPGNVSNEKPYCTNYSIAPYYNNPSNFTLDMLNNKIFQNTKLLEDRINCTITEKSTETLVFNSDGSGIFKNFDFFNNGGYVVDFKFTTIIDNGILKMSGNVNGNPAIINLKLIGEDSNYYFTEAEWSLNKDIEGYYRKAIFKLLK